MKGFAYTARDAAGKTKSGFISAADRATAIGNIRALGLIPIDIQEAAGARQGPVPGRHSRTLVLAAATVLAAIVALIVFLKRPASRLPSPVSRLQSPAYRLPSPASRLPSPDASLASPDSRLPSPVSSLPSPASHLPPPDSPLPPPAHTDPNALAETPAASGATTEEAPAEVPPKPEQIYKTGTEQLLAMLGRPGEPVPPLPIAPHMNLKDDLKRAMTNLITIYENDDPHEVNRKETVAWLKVQLAEMDKEGWDPADVIKALASQRQEEAAERKAAASLLSEMVRENPEKAEEIRAAINADLLSKGLLPLPPRPQRPPRKEDGNP